MDDIYHNLGYGLRIHDPRQRASLAEVRSDDNTPVAASALEKNIDTLQAKILELQPWHGIASDLAEELRDAINILESEFGFTSEKHRAVLKRFVEMGGTPGGRTS